MRTGVAIVMATYDGAAHVQEQIRSLQAQDFKEWRLFVRDDGSSDRTREILSQAAREDGRVTVLDARERLGVVRNFGALLQYARDAGAEYVFPCDQDDVWLPDKVSRLLAAMAELEARHGRERPLLVHSDLAVVDENLRPLHGSFLRRQGIAHEPTDPLNVLLVQNFVTGCASLLNRALLDLAVPVPEQCIMHDWWIAQCAAATGAIGFVPEPTILYRQHAANQVGATGALGNLNVLTAPGRRRFARSWKVGVQSIVQARDLLVRLCERGAASPASAEVVGAYARIGAEPVPWRLWTLRRHGIRRQRPLGTLLLYVRTAFLGVAVGANRLRA